MKKIIHAWIEQILEFDSTDEIQHYLNDLDSKKQNYLLICKDGLRIRIRKQYNRNTFPKKEGK